MRQLASDIGISSTRIRRTVKNKLKIHSYRLQGCRMLTAEMSNMKKLYQDTCTQHRLQRRENLLYGTYNKPLERPDHWTNRKG